ncbi:MAG: TIGR02611 family protein [Micromonosporaceae bacterium]
MTTVVTAERDEVADVKRPGWLDRIRATVSGWLDRTRATAAGRLTLKVVVAIVGVAFVAIGIVMIPLPGPGWAVVLLGLLILSIEYVWAKHLLHYARQKLTMWTHWMGRQSWPVRIVIGAVGLLFVGAVSWWAIRNSFGIDLVQSAWHFVTSN